MTERKSATETMWEEKRQWEIDHPLAMELLACADSHAHIASVFSYTAINDDPEIMQHAKQMTDIVKFQHGRWAELIRCAAAKIDDWSE